jgi:hypothetical protein
MVLVELQGTGGQTVWVNPDQVISVRRPHGIPQGHWPEGTRCVVLTSDGKFFTTAENCEQVRQKLDKWGQ